jgi:2-dehydropantoate 2-reductase
MTEFTIVGAGAIGGIVGAALVDAGHSIAFVDTNADHVAAIRERGLRLSGFREAAVTCPAFLPQDVPHPLNRVLLAVKSPHTEKALGTIAPRLGDSGYVVSLQNGLEEYKIAKAVGTKRTIGAFLTFGGHYKEPGHVVYGGPGTFKIGELDGSRTARIVELRSILSALQPVDITDNIFGYLWAKMALGAIYFATAITDQDVTALYADPRLRTILGRLAGEVVAVGEAQGVRFEAFDGFDPTAFRPGAPWNEAAVAASWDGQVRYWNRHEGKRTGVWRDLAIHKRKTEVDRLVGAVIDVADEREIPVPGVRRLVDLVHEIENGKRGQSVANLDLIAAAVGV